VLRQWAGTRGTLNAAIADLRPLYRDVFVLRTVEELSTFETARTLGVTMSTVKTRLRRARVELRSYLKSCGEMVQSLGALAGESGAEVSSAN